LTSPPTPLRRGEGSIDYQFLAASQEFDRREVERWLEAERTKEIKARLVQAQKAIKFQRLFFLSIFIWTLVLAALLLYYSKQKKLVIRKFRTWKNNEY
jgi:hypothetical protein